MIKKWQQHLHPMLHLFFFKIHSLLLNQEFLNEYSPHYNASSLVIASIANIAPQTTNHFNHNSNSNQGSIGREGFNHSRGQSRGDVGSLSSRNNH